MSMTGDKYFDTANDGDVSCSVRGGMDKCWYEEGVCTVEGMEMVHRML